MHSYSFFDFRMTLERIQLNCSDYSRLTIVAILAHVQHRSESLVELCSRQTALVEECHDLVKQKSERTLIRMQVSVFMCR